ncbi:helix-turn-helix transcriptional regulator [Micromonospora sp. WMMD1102]|uniref:helix-turn-helix domain-containing protein n=1 Tax=Micromonospora sp. WMMD1102 TaxID=3016105 RepID=UPI0024150716|nr:helix-turn-helix transcriptional regulator [Micromonospora sp. WMMD1102]MDG4789053.1 helix-turn-helix transcriptional regulator [Micromonospora sp. WMMD1102]
MLDQSASLPARIRALRTERKLSQDRLAVAIGVSKSTVQYFEAGKLIPQEGTAQRLDGVFGTDSEIQGLAKTAHEDLRPWLRPWAENVRRAILLRSWEPLLIPAPLQREPYMREMFAGVPANVGRVEDLVADRAARQAAVLDQNPPVTISCIIAEFALRRGSRDVMKDQLGYLVDIGHRPFVTVRVLPDVAGGLHAGLGGPISLATLRDGRRISYLDDQLQGKVVASVRDVGDLELSWESINGLAMTTDQSRDLLLEVLNEHK